MKNYYTRKELPGVVDLQKRQIDKRIKKYRYDDRYKDKIYKHKGVWRIDKSVIYLFDRKVSYSDMKVFISVGFKNPNSDKIKALMRFLHTRLKADLYSELKTLYTIELNNTAEEHLHFLVNLHYNDDNKKYIFKMIRELDKDTHIDIREIYEVDRLYQYIHKDYTHREIIKQLLDTWFLLIK